MFLSFSALLTVNAFAPQMFWDNNKIQGRFPSSLEEDRLEQLELDKKEQEKKEELKKNEASIQCLKDDKSSKLDEEVKKLMADKEAILKELEELKKDRKENKKEEDMAEMAATMQQQMMFIMPIMTVFFALKFPAGLALYWVVTTVYSIGQQYAISGPGGLVTYAKRLQLIIAKRTK